MDDPIMDWDWLKQIEIPGLTGLLGVVGTYLTVRGRERSDRASQELQRFSTAATTQAAREQAQMSLDAATAATLTARFTALMDGYEHRIDDLTREGRERLARLEKLERQFGIHRTICNNCDAYQRYMKEHPNALDAAT